MNAKTINEILKIKESYELPNKLLELLLMNDDTLFHQFLEAENDLSYDWFNNYFQEQHSNRDDLKQDFTPQEVSYLVNKLAGTGQRIADICAGTGTLTIKHWIMNSSVNVEYYCEEYSTRAVPLLLFNLAIRGMNATVVNCDTLSRETFAMYEVVNNGQFSKVKQIDELPVIDKFDCVIMNPPYSQKWTQADDERFSDFGLAPKTKADYAFLLHGLSLLSDSGTLVVILPHGVLFRGATEGKIRQNIIDNNLLDGVIGLPDKLFMNTSIPVCLIILKKNKSTEDTLFIDASQYFEKLRANNKLTDEDVARILNAYQQRAFIDKYADVVTLDKMKDNDYNLNIPRYVDTFEQEEVTPLNECLCAFVKLQKEIKEAEDNLFNVFNELVDTDESSSEELVEAKKYIQELKKVI